MKKNLAELFGTYMLVMIGPGSVVVGLSNFWISVCFGFIVTLMILFFGNISGAHINPMVSLSSYFINRDYKLLIYIPFQLFGAFLASATVWIIVPETTTFGETVLSVPLSTGMLIEFLISFGLMFTILMIVRKGSLQLTAFVVGFYVFLAAYFFGPMTGASMNPARTFGPAVFSNTLNLFWLYILMPVLGGISAVLLENYLINRNLFSKRS